ncbi:ABC transporter permease [Bosea lathyri]|uniref:Peptide/nickel transport system permease protein n=1 Tax=Bosea lathyri TaxID=1036778 RepID=A0A1H6DB15_9HYPH|nr:ABC transporter permease [Bosea lathyri]SEG82053.1 peptide/nickel transport system permease protein [Bosea lathyri]
MASSNGLSELGPQEPGLKFIGWKVALRNPKLVIGTLLLVALIALAVFAPLIAGDPLALDPFRRLQKPSSELLLGADHLGRDVFARTVFGGRVSLLVGLASAGCAIIFGLIIGILAGYSHRVDAIVMRLMDGVMSLPTILLAIAMVAISGGGIGILVIAIMIPQIPSVARLVRSVVLSTKQLPFVEAAVCAGARTPRILLRHILPSTVAPLIVQSAYVCANAILTEAGLSFLGAGVPPEIPSWGNMISASRIYLPVAPWSVFAPGIALAAMVLAVNLLGDGIRIAVDPKSRRR